MNAHVVFRQTLPILLLTALRAVAPALVAVATLRVVAAFYGVDFDVAFRVLSILVIALGVLILKPTGSAVDELPDGRVPVGMEMVLRWLLLTLVLLLVGYLTQFAVEFSRRVIFTWLLVTPVLLVCAAVLLDWLLRRAIVDTAAPRRVLFAGYNDISTSLAGRIRRHPELCMSLVGYFDDRSAERLGALPEDRLLGGLADIAAYVKRENIDLLFVALPMRHIQRVLNLLDELRDTTCSIYYVPDVFVFDLIQARTVDIAGIPAVAMCETPFYGYRGVVKRLMDLVLATVGVAVILPLLIAIAVAVKVGSRGPVIFTQRRYGLDGQEILVYKFRTMTVLEDGGQVRQATRDDDRITPVGRVLRRYSLDELPQLFNVIQGRMSLVGPRPHAVAHNEEYRRLIKGYMVRHKVLPGITGLAQVNGCRGETTRLEDMQARIDFDLDYLRHWSPALDVRILARTLLRMFSDAKAY
jgi:putative colanic acid biosynthesis UDP-glucose lipid carrier transferase